LASSSEPANLVPDATVWLCAVLPAQRGGKRTKDRVTGQNIKGRNNQRDLQGSIAFICLQLIMVATILIYHHR
jgi:hypothetical protein